MIVGPLRGTMAFVVTGLVLSLVALPASPARADADSPVRVTITGMAPVALSSGTSLTLRGTVANTGLAEVTDVSVRLTLSTSVVGDRRSLRRATESDAAYGSFPIYGTTVAVADALAPGAKTDYRVTVERELLPLAAPGVYVVGIEAVGYGTAGYVILGSERTLIPYVPDPVDPVNVAWLWPLATWPGQTPDDVLLGDLIPRELAPGGRLDDVLRAGASSPALTWVVDPQVLQVASEMADGYLVEKGGETRAGTASDAAADWLRLARTTLREPQGRGSQARLAPLYALPYADPDADAVVRAGLTTDLVRAATSATSLTSNYLGRAPDGTIAWAAGGVLDRATIDILASAGVRAAVVRARAVPDRVDPGYTPSGYVDVDTTAGPVRALVIDSGLLTALEMPQGNQATILAARQRFLAELAFVALEPTDETRYLVAAAASPRWDPNPRLLRAIIASLRGTPWTRLTPVSTLLRLPTTPTVTSLEPRLRRGRELEGAYLTRVREVQASVESLRTVLSDPLPVTSPITTALLRAESSAWRSRPRGGGALLDAVEASVQDTQSGIYVVPRENVTFSGDRGSVPVTVANDLDQAVTVGVVVSAYPTARLVADSLEPVEIEPGKRASLEVPVRIVGGEALTVNVQLTDARGEAFGEPVALELRTTAYSRAALWVAIAAAVVLALLVVFDIVRRSRQRRAAQRGTST